MLRADKQRIQLVLPFSFLLSNRTQNKKKYCSKCIHITSAASIIFQHACKQRESLIIWRTTLWALSALLLPFPSLDNWVQIQSTRAEPFCSGTDQLSLHRWGYLAKKRNKIQNWRPCFFSSSQNPENRWYVPTGNGLGASHLDPFSLFLKVK